LAILVVKHLSILVVKQFKGLDFFLYISKNIYCIVFYIYYILQSYKISVFSILIEFIISFE
jgi:hypothetical protein